MATQENTTRSRQSVVATGDTLFQESQKTHTPATEPLHMTAVLDGHGDALMDEVVKEWDSIITNLYGDMKRMDNKIWPRKKRILLLLRVMVDNR